MCIESRIRFGHDVRNRSKWIRKQNHGADLSTGCLRGTEQNPFDTRQHHPRGTAKRVSAGMLIYCTMCVCQLGYFFLLIGIISLSQPETLKERNGGRFSITCERAGTKAPRVPGIQRRKVAVGTVWRCSAVSETEGRAKTPTAGRSWGLRSSYCPSSKSSPLAPEKKFEGVSSFSQSGIAR